MHALSRSLPALLAAALLLGPVTAAHAAFLPVFDIGDFAAGAPVDNPYFPLIEGRKRTFQGKKEEDGETVVERFVLTDLGAGPTILGVSTQIQQDHAFEDGLLVEATFDYYGQDVFGNVWYFGEDVTNFFYDESDNLIGTDTATSWRAGVNDALPGFIMPADLTLGFNYFQEFAPNDAALDEGTTFALLDSVSIGIGDFFDVLQVLETTALALDVRGFKFYAPGIGLILEEEGVDEQFMNPELRIEMVAPAPEPGTLGMLALGVMMMLGVTRRVGGAGRGAARRRLAFRLAPAGA